MNILVVSDTHRNIDALYDVVSKNRLSTDLVIHLGDCFTDLKSVMSDFPTIAHLSVIGNCDFASYDSSVKNEGTFTVDRRKIFYTHGHKYNVKFGVDYLVSNAKFLGADIALYGHTHLSCAVEKNGVLVINPGSLVLPRDNTSGTYAKLEINGNDVKYNFFEV